MPAPTSTADILEIIRKSQLVGSDRLESLASESGNDPGAVIRQLQADGTLTPFQAEQLLKGRHKGFVLGKYRLLDRIGMGGMGQVYLAEHATMKRRVAIKVLPPDRCGNEFARERFQREAKAAAAVEHPNLVRAYDLEMDGDVSFLVMEFIDGVTLHELVARRGPLAPGRAAHYIWQIANGLEAIHCFQLVHRDIKPANLLLDRGGVVPNSTTMP
jgi:eukaryotic-like serine/threonine-protein kinase